MLSLRLAPRVGEMGSKETSEPIETNVLPFSNIADWKGSFTRLTFLDDKNSSETGEICFVSIQAS